MIIWGKMILLDMKTPMEGHKKVAVPIFVISILNSDRRPTIKKSFAKLSVDFQFFDAVVGRHLTDTQKQQLYDDNKAKQVEFSLTHPEIGCALSHCGIYGHMIDNNIPSALIFEDDVQINENLPLFLKTYQDLIPQNADIVLLGGHYHRFLRTQKILSWLMLRKTPFMVNGQQAILGKCYVPSGGAHGYFITQAGAKKMLAHQSPKVCWGADSLTGDMVVGGHNLYAILPYIVGLQSIASEIGTDYSVNQDTNKVSYNKFIRLLMIEFPWFKQFMIFVKTGKK